jgi:predicted ATPase
VLRTIAVQNYRSLHELRVPMGALTVVTGANGSGKTTLYRALRLLADCADRHVIGSLAREGGLPSALWAGPEVISGAVRRGEHPLEGTRRAQPVSLQLGFASDEFSYLIDLGIPVRAASAFNLDPEIKRELVWAGKTLRPATLLARRAGPLVEVRGSGAGSPWVPVVANLESYESMLTEVGDPRDTPELLDVRAQVRSWRFYDHFRTDENAPARQLQIGTRSPVLDPSGGDLAATLQTIREIGDARLLAATIADAFPDTELTVEVVSGRFELRVHSPGLLRPLSSAELSDGTLRYLLLVAALLSPRPPRLLVLNEPETSLHPALLPALARLMSAAAQRSQVLVITHSAPLLDALHAEAEVTTIELISIELIKDLGETRIAGQDRLDGPAWSWGHR